MEPRNIALGKQYEIINAVPMNNSYSSLEKGNKNILTDGNTADPSDWYGGGWAHFYRGFKRSVILDLEEVFAVCGIDIGFIHNKKAGIICPETVNVSVSLNKSEFHRVADISSPYPASFGLEVRAPYKASFKKPYRARYIRIDFDVDVNVFCDEIKVFGNEPDGLEETASGERVTEISVGAYANRESLGGIYDIPLLYYGYWPENERIARNTKDDFIPYIAYIDRDGKIIDKMFDSVMFLILQGRCPSGGSLGYHGKPGFLSDWRYIMNELFLKGYSLDALDQAVAEMKKALSLDNEYRLKVYLTAPVPKVSLEPFGDLNGDGIEEKLLSTDDCINAYLRYVDEVTRRFIAEGYRNIIIDGWFWNNESVSRINRDDEEYFAKSCVKGLHERGYKCVFIPYFQAGGAEKSKDIGFDCVTMQPNISFNAPLQKNPRGAMKDFTAACKKYGFGVELEIHHGVKNQATKYFYGDIFLEYMRSCMNNGMMTDTVHTYYQCAGPGVFYDCAHSNDEYLRGIYDKLYKFINGTLTESDFASTADKKDLVCGTAETVCEPEKAAEEPKEIPRQAAEEIKEEPIKKEIKENSPDFTINENKTPKETVLPKSEISNEKLELDELKKKIKRKKKIMLSAGIAAAVIGTAYIIGKAAGSRRKGNKNG